jgi:hypothetical protein
MADADQATDEGWLLLVYRVPSEPSPGQAPELGGTGASALLAAGTS